jgi:hypothetical protein
MQDRLNQNDVTNRVNVEKPKEVRDAVLRLFTARYPGANLAALERAFEDFHALFEGRYPGFLACDTLYHDIRHTLDMTLAMARLVDGHDRSCAPSERIGARRAVMGIVIALLHDSGYLKRSSEASVQNGAIFTKVHVSRSADFIAAYLPKIGYAAEAPLAARLVHFTGYEMDIADIPVHDLRERMIGCMVGTADLIGQMSDRMYLEKVRQFLYEEFVWGTRGPDLQDPRLLRVRGAHADPEEAGRRGSLRRVTLRRSEPLPERDRAQHGIPSRGDRVGGPQPPAPLLLFPLGASRRRANGATRRRLSVVGS